jgi:succinoglycan biosynthesis transport protein ExoP
MSGPISPDALAGESRSATGSHTHVTNPSDSPSDSIMSRVARRWWLVVGAVALALVGAIVYLATADTVYSATSVLSMDPLAGGDKAPPDEFLGSQRELLTSPIVLAAASTAAAMPHLRDALTVRLSIGERLLILRVDAADAQSAARGANAVVEAYLKAHSALRSSAATSLSSLMQQRDDLVARRAGAEKALKDFRDSASMTGIAADKPAGARLEQLTQALTAAQLDLANATAAATAAQSMLGDPAKIKQIIEANRSKGIFAGLDQQKTQAETELTQSQALFQRQKETMLPQHPKVLETQRKIEQLQARRAAIDKQYGDVYSAYLDQQRLTAQRKVQELQGLVNDQGALTRDSTAKAAKLAALDADLNRADAAVTEVDRKLRDVAVTGETSAGALAVVQAAQPPARPSHPDRNRTLTTALLIGLAGGLLLAGIGKPTR